MKISIAKWILLSISLISNTLILHAQDESEKKMLLTTRISSIGYFSFSNLDPYLSPLNYSGQGVSYTTRSKRFINAHSTNLSRQTSFEVHSGIGLNPAKNATEISLMTNYSYGIQYHIRANNKLTLLVGGTLDGTFSSRTIDRNINNPVNFDLNTNLNIATSAQYKINLLNRKLKLEANFQTPLLGCMYVPHQGATYYEMFMLSNLKNIAHFSSLHNKLGLDAGIAVYIPLNRTTWRIGLNCSNLKYQANEMVFKQEMTSISIGTCISTIKFAGIKNNPPANFLNSDL